MDTLNDQPQRADPVPLAAGQGVHAERLVKRYGTGIAQVTALDGIDVSIQAGEAVALMGPSGSGKSTLLHLAGAMDRPTSGTLRVGHVNVHQLRGAQAAQYRRSVGFVFQSFHLLVALTALDNVLAPLIATGKARRDQARAIQVLELVGLGDRLTALPSQLSGGQRQRVAVARALVNNPGLILADEPTGNLDTHTGDEVIDLLLSLRDRFGTTLLLATHDQRVAGRLDRTIALVDGRLSS
ncbi:MAG: ABC transporter ATP-binding protein [Steroidobacteraceae bacterium]